MSDIVKFTYEGHALDRISRADGDKTLSDTAKILGFGPIKFCEQLRKDGILFKRDGANIPYQQYVGNYFNVVVTEGKRGDKNYAFTQTFVTPRGVTWLAERYRELNVFERIRGLQ